MNRYRCHRVLSETLCIIRLQKIYYLTAEKFNLAYMKKISLILLLTILCSGRLLHSQAGKDTTVYLLTCAPGIDTYSIYGHSALRVVIPKSNIDIVYNWGVFDFATPNFAWKFAKGKLNYILGAYPYERFMQTYFYEQRSVYSQVVNLESEEKRILLSLIERNLLPEFRSYRYDFFYDDCSTRIRDLIERVVGSKLIYPPDETNKLPSFRELVGDYQKNYAWLKMGVDLIMGTPGDAKASFRERMFLPLHLQKNLSQAVINRDRKMVPLLSSAETLLSFEPRIIKTKFWVTPIFIFSLLFIIIVLLSALYYKRKIIKIMDIILFTAFSILAILMIFFNFFTDHQQMRWNLNITWFNPAIIICLMLLFFGKSGKVWFSVVFFLSVIFLPIVLIFPYAFNFSFVPVTLILALRSSARAGFKWNPLTLEE
jgi:hypothetical protein